MISMGKAIINLLLSMRVRTPRSPFPPSAWSLLWLAALAALPWFGSLAVPARADIQEPIKAHTSGEREQRRGEARIPATPSPRQVQIHQGEAIEIVLTARGQIGRTIEFMVRSQPVHGRLEGPPRQLTRNTASVTYVHRAEDGPGDDEFTYAVQLAGGAVSASVPVSVTVLEDPPLLAATPAELDFGAVKAGETTRATLTLENRGGGTAVGHVELPPPWIVDGSADYHLSHGESQGFQVVFHPAYGRSYVESTHFRPGNDTAVRLIGTGIGPRDPSEDTAGSAGVAPDFASSSPIAATIARNNALALAAENAAAEAASRISASASGSSSSGVSSPNAGSPARSPAAMPEPGSSSVSSSSASSPSSNMPPAADTFAGAEGLPEGGVDSVVLNEAPVKDINLRGQGTSTLDLSWTPPRPTPKSYRVELRYLRLDEDEKLHVDWRPYAKVDVRVAPDTVKAQVSGLPAGQRQTIRVVAVDDAGHLALPSPTLSVMTRPASTWWHVTPLKVLAALLLACMGLLIYRKWEEQQILRSIDESRAERDAGLMYRP